MARLNRAVFRRGYTEEGGAAYAHLDAEQALRRSVMSCFLWEQEFYEDGQSIAERIVENARKVPAAYLADLAVDLRSNHNLRHVPLLLLSVLADTSKGNSLVADTVNRVIQRADELAEFPTVFCNYKDVKPSELKKVMPHGMKRGLAEAFKKFNAYSLAKYNRDGAVKLRDVLFLCHSKPLNDEQKLTWGQLINGSLPTPDTWETELSAGKDKKETFERLIKENKLGYFALIRNLRNMDQAGCDSKIVEDAIRARKGAERLLPFRFTAAARHAPRFEPALDEALQASIKLLPELSGLTVVLVDISASMDQTLSARSDMTRVTAAATLGSIINGKSRVFTFSRECVEVPPRKGMAGVDVIIKSQIHSSTNLGDALKRMAKIEYDRLIVITDEQSQQVTTAPRGKRNYLINVASYQNGVGYGKDWIHIDGFSENVLKFIHELEQEGGE